MKKNLFLIFFVVFLFFLILNLKVEKKTDKVSFIAENIVNSGKLLSSELFNTGNVIEKKGFSNGEISYNGFDISNFSGYDYDKCLNFYGGKAISVLFYSGILKDGCKDTTKKKMFGYINPISKNNKQQVCCVFDTVLYNNLLNCGINPDKKEINTQKELLAFIECPIGITSFINTHFDGMYFSNYYSSYKIKTDLGLYYERKKTNIRLQKIGERIE